MMIQVFFILFASLFIHSTQQELVFLPGVNDLQSGYDGAKMLSASEQRSRFRIFDLNDKSNTPFILKVNGKEHSYATPTYAQVTDVSTRKENNCESISYSFEEFYRRYFEFILIYISFALKRHFFHQLFSIKFVQFRCFNYGWFIVWYPIS